MNKLAIREPVSGWRNQQSRSIWLSCNFAGETQNTFTGEMIHISPFDCKFKAFLICITVEFLSTHAYTRCTSMKCRLQTTDGAPEQFCYKDLTLRHFVVLSTNVRRARVINWKCARVVLCCCVWYVEHLYRTTSIRGQH